MSSVVAYNGKQLTRYGLTCGYWTNRASKLDHHVMRHFAANGLDGKLFDLFAEQWQGEKLHQCRDGIK